MDSRTEELFERAIELPPEQRAEFLDDACRGDDALRKRLESLIVAHETNLGFLPAESAEDVPTDFDGDQHQQGLASDDKVGSVVDGYKLLERLGEGGFGVVWVAQQFQPVRRKVALKIIKPGMDSKQVVARFEAERQALALMDHPSIARVYDGGTTESGRPYFVMELIRGIPITSYADQEKLTTEQRISLFVETCYAIQHAHQKGIIHRDIKPSNVLVALHDGAPLPKVIDFGVAKATQHSLTENTVHTQLQHLIGTPAYMSPEQAEMTGVDIDTRSDIYSLGVLLYELLTGQTPFDSKELLAAGLDAMRKLIREREPIKPSSRVSSLAELDRRSTTERRRVHSAPKLVSRIRGDLDWIVLKCLEKDRTRRYDSSNSLADDLNRHLQNEPVSARPPSTFYRMRKLWLRNRVAVSMAILVLMILSATSAISAWQAQKARQAAAAARRSLYATTMGFVQQARQQHDMRRVEQLLDETKFFSDRGFEWYYWQQQLRLNRRTLRGHVAQVDAVLFSLDGKQVISAGRDRTVRIWDAATGKELGPALEHDALVFDLALSNDGATLYAADWANKIKVWDWKNRRELFELDEHSVSVRRLAISDNGMLASSDSGSNAIVWDVKDSSSEPRVILRRKLGRCVDISSDGTMLVSCSFDAESPVIKLFDLNESRLTEIAVRTNASQAKFSPDGTRILSTHVDGSVAIWDLAGNEQFLVRGHRPFIGGLDFSPDGRFAATGGDGSAIKIWDVQEGKEVRTLLGHLSRVRAVAISPNGRQLASAAHDMTVRLWDIGEDKDQLSIPHEAPLTCLALSADGMRLATGSEDMTAVVRSVASNEPPVRLGGHRDWVYDVAFSPDGYRVATASGDGTATLWSVASGQALSTFRLVDRAVSVCFSPDGQSVVTGCWNGVVAVWDSTAPAEPIRQWQAHEGPVWDIAFSADGSEIITGGEDGVAKIWNARNGKRLAILAQHNRSVRSVAYATTATGKRLIATGSVDKTACLWNATNKQMVHHLQGHREPVWSVAFSPDGTRLVTASKDDTIRVWDTTSGRELLQVDDLSSGVLATEFTSDGFSLVTAFEQPKIYFSRAMPAARFATVQQEEQLIPEALRRIPRGFQTESPATESEWAKGVPGAVRQWLVLSPIRVSPDQSVDQAILVPHVDETELLARTSDLPREGSSETVGERQLDWRPTSLSDYQLDLRAVLGDGTSWNSCLAYAVCYVYSSEQRADVKMKIGYDDLMRVYLNNNVVFAPADQSAFKLDSHTVDGITLEKGRNILLVKDLNTIGPWNISVRFTNADDQPLEGIDVAINPGRDSTPSSSTPP